MLLCLKTDISQRSVLEPILCFLNSIHLPEFYINTVAAAFTDDSAMLIIMQSNNDEYRRTYKELFILKTRLQNCTLNLMNQSLINFINKHIEN